MSEAWKEKRRDWIPVGRSVGRVVHILIFSMDSRKRSGGQIAAPVCFACLFLRYLT